MGWSVSYELPAGVTARQCAEQAMQRLKELELCDPNDTISYHEESNSYSVACSTYEDLEDPARRIWITLEVFDFYEPREDGLLWVDKGCYGVPGIAKQAICEAIENLCCCNQ